MKSSDALNIRNTILLFATTTSCVSYEMVKYSLLVRINTFSWKMNFTKLRSNMFSFVDICKVERVMKSSLLEGFVNIRLFLLEVIWVDFVYSVLSLRPSNTRINSR